jgi:hypothetical protein
MKKYSFLLIIFTLVFGFGIHLAHADSTQPQINMTSTPTSANITVNFPTNYSAEVVSTYNPTNGWQTKTETLSQSQITAMNQAFANQQKQLDELFQAQENFFSEQQSFFNSLLSNFGN